MSGNMYNVQKAELANFVLYCIIFVFYISMSNLEKSITFHGSKDF